MTYLKILLLMTVIASWMPSHSIQKKVTIDYESEEIQEEEEEGEELAA